ncbi:class I SAM-dependent methyltransferase [Luteimicrobium subarcticum]|uniref:16S rRNA m(2)G 1207 methyltransferase /23S rRNA m(2)G-1835 methyltransferase n=1 Tax=Luteimicrobium subarcticum TaxID=620910 RepID=A0A2M8WT96_9MICO|nr:methyltransferase [Luteimicrobium subarcticum]PJI94153.1 16S rRNA m(2)G 1207 methyltransferase /23S rRNA m(2)G-1835 methyltransferase [Luteimicrobium subarcticum]
MTFPALADLLASLHRWPDVEAPELVAVDGADRLLLDELAALLEGGSGRGDGGIVVLDDAYGALTLGASTLVDAPVRVWQDSIVAERALDANARRAGLADRVVRSGPATADGPGTTAARSADGAPTEPTPPPARPAGGLVPTPTLAGASVVLVRLPRGLDALAELAESVARDAGPDVVVLAGGMVKHMTPAMNDVLGRSFSDVHATRGRYKARVLVARGPRPGVVPSFPVAADVPDAGLTVWAHGATFAGARLDRGTRALLDGLGGAGADGWGGADPRVVLDLGCGTGILATRAALALPAARVVATDRSASAVASARRTADAAGAGDRVDVLRDDVASRVPDGSVDLVLCNPPFHVGSAVHTGAASKMFAAAARVLRPGGELWTVWNSHLRYRAELQRVVGPTVQVSRDRTFTVTRSVRPL